MRGRLAGISTTMLIKLEIFFVWRNVYGDKILSARVIEKRDATTIPHYIEKHMSSLTHIFSDGWAVYTGICDIDLYYMNIIVSCSIAFVNEDREHAKSIKGWMKQCDLLKLPF